MKKSMGIWIALVLVFLAGCSAAEPVVPEQSSSSVESADIESSSRFENNSAPSFSAGESTSSPAESSSAVEMQASTKPTEPPETEKPTAPAVSSQAAPHTTSSRLPSSQPTQAPQPTEPPVSSTPETPQQTEKPDPAVVAQKVVEYINQYRNEQGDTTMTVLPGLTKVAEYRSRQLVTNFSHNFDEDPCMILKYGELIDMTEFGLPESYNYYRGYNAEAIGKGRWTGTADEIARQIATGFRNSTGHWSYVGSSEYSYVAVGVTYNPSTWDTWYCCVCVSSKDYGG